MTWQTFNNSTLIAKQSEGAYKLWSVSTAAIPDLETETFTTRAIDYDIKHAKRTGQYPEYRVYHSPLLGIGKVTKMYRVGIFAVEEGYSYTDPFSLQVCKMLSESDGKWRTSRGFKPLLVQFGCKSCGNTLAITQKHMVIGYKCPVCSNGHITYKGAQGIQYLEAVTFDITATDNPAVPMTGMTAMKLSDNDEDNMNKSTLKQRLLDLGVDEDVVDARLNIITDDQLKEYDAVPDALVLKSIEDDENEVEDDEDAVDYNAEIELDDSVLDAISDRFKSVLDDAAFEIHIPDVSVDPAIVATMKEMQERLDMLYTSIAELTKELQGSAPKARLKVYGGIADDGDERDTIKKWLRPQSQIDGNTGIVDGSGKSFTSMTDFIIGNK